MNCDVPTDLVCQVEVEDFEPVQFQNRSIVVMGSTYDRQPTEGQDTTEIVLE